MTDPIYLTCQSPQPIYLCLALKKKVALCISMMYDPGHVIIEIMNP